MPVFIKAINTLSEFVWNSICIWGLHTFSFYCGALRLWAFPYCKHVQLQVKPFRYINKCLPYNWKWKWSRDVCEGRIITGVLHTVISPCGWEKQESSAAGPQNSSTAALEGTVATGTSDSNFLTSRTCSMGIQLECGLWVSHHNPTQYRRVKGVFGISFSTGIVSSHNLNITRELPLLLQSPQGRGLTCKL